MKKEKVKRSRGRPAGGGPAAADRRSKVKKLKADGFNNIQIAQILDINRNTVAKDLTYIAKETRKQAEEADSMQELGETLDRLQMYEEQAVQVLRNVDPGDIRTRLECIKTASNLRTTRINLAISSGLIPKIDRESDRDFVDEIARMTDAELDKRQKILLDKLGVSIPFSEETDAPIDKEKWEKKQQEMQDGLSFETGSESYNAPLPPEESLEEAEKYYGKKDLEIITGKRYDDSDSSNPSDVTDGE